MENQCNMLQIFNFSVSLMTLNSCFHQQKNPDAAIRIYVSII